MNLVAKEYVVARKDEQGVLILSRFTGASHELADALMVNPYDTDELAQAIHTALSMPPDERQARMQRMRAVVQENNVYRWAGDLIGELAAIRLAPAGANGKVQPETRGPLLPLAPVRSGMKSRRLAGGSACPAAIFCLWLGLCGGAHAANQDPLDRESRAGAPASGGCGSGRLPIGLGGVGAFACQAAMAPRRRMAPPHWVPDPPLSSPCST
jgi:glycosyl transferase family 20